MSSPSRSTKTSKAKPAKAIAKKASAKPKAAAKALPAPKKSAPAAKGRKPAAPAKKTAKSATKPTSKAPPKSLAKSAGKPAAKAAGKGRPVATKSTIAKPAKRVAASKPAVKSPAKKVAKISSPSAAAAPVTAPIAPVIAPPESFAPSEVERRAFEPAPFDGAQRSSSSPAPQSGSQTSFDNRQSRPPQQDNQPPRQGFQPLRDDRRPQARWGQGQRRQDGQNQNRGGEQQNRGSDFSRPPQSQQQQQQQQPRNDRPPQSPRPEYRNDRDRNRDQRPPHGQQQPPRDQRPPQHTPVAPAVSAAILTAAPSAGPVPSSSPRPDHVHTPAGPDHPGKDEVFDRGKKFADLGLRDSVLKGITEAGFEYPTSIQASLIPIILSGKDVLGQAKTGTGKTAAFGLPLLHKIQKGQPFQALVLVPTRELAIQVATDLRELGRFTPLQILPVYGGQNVKTQAQLLSRGPEIIVATPGRVMDMVQRGFINYRSITTVVLDEVDRMLDIGFRDDIRRILSGCPRERQTVFVSATISTDVEALARSFARECEKIVASSGSLTVSMVKQYHLPVQPWDKKQLLLHLLTHEEPALTVVFCRTKKTVDNIGEYLMRKGVDCHAIHGDMYQNKRNKVIEQLKAGKLEVLVASDVASRGLDVDGITHVINYDLPEDPDLYVHRIGRTARAGRQGVAWSLVTPEQGELLTQIEFLINAEIPKLDYPDFKPGPVPQDVLARQQFDAKRVENARQFNRFSSTPAPGAPVAQPPQNQPQTQSPNADGSTRPAAPAHVPAPMPRPAPDLNRFPGGIVPTMAPPKRMFGKVKTARSMRQANQAAPVIAPASPPAAATTATVVATTDPVPQSTP